MVGTYVFIEVQKQQVKREVKWKMIEGIASEELEQLTFHQKDIEIVLNWKHSKEFSYLGEMYDVVKMLNHGDSITYLCWWDNKETKLNKQLANVLNEFIGNKPINQKNKDQVISFYTKLYCPSNLTENFLWFEQERLQINENSLALPLRYITPTSPPPESYTLHI